MVAICIVGVTKENGNQLRRYTSDHKQAGLIWSKPGEISNYKFAGYEISFGYGHDARKTHNINPVGTVQGWIHSKGHNDVMLERGAFKHTRMKVMGVGVYKGIANVWFGEELDTYPAPS